MTKICLILTLLISVTQILIVGRFATLGESITTLKSRAHALREENQLYTETLLSTSSAVAIEAKANQLGFKLATIAFEKSPQALAKVYESH